jgi:hypothetical protein
MSRVNVAAALVVPLATVTLAAQVTRIAIDIAPGDSPTVIEAGRGGLLPVAILSTPAFDATTIDPSTIRFGPTGTEAEPARTVTEDVDRDDRVDMMSLIRVADVPLPCGDVDMRLKAETSTGAAVEGVERVTIIGCASQK